MDLNTRIDKFAQLAMETGINMKPGESVLIRADINASDFVRRCVREGYRLGAKHVYVEYSDEQVTREHYLDAPSEAFDEYPTWQSDKYTQLAKEGCSFLSIVSTDPDIMSGVDADRIGRYQKVAAKHLQEWRSYNLNNKVKWCIVAAPSKAWAKRVHPDLTEDDAYIKLWEEILDCSRVDDDPVKAWEIHNKNLNEKTQLLNEMNFKELRYESSKTHLVVGLPEGHIWESGASKDPKGNSFNPNIPSEEVFCMPHKYKVDGIVHSTKPLVYAGSIIDNFWLKFEAGRVVDFDAETGKENLANLLKTDDGASRLGEVALVPYDSPISNSNIVFYTTLFDENASCHFAIGAAYGSNIKDGALLNERQKDKVGMNDSLTHVDFMIGDKDLNIVGITYEGEEFAVFKNGNWAF